MSILVTGGAGYIGSHVVRELLNRKYNVVVIDSLENGFIQSLPKDVSLFKGDLGDKKFLSKVFSSSKIDAVIHFAGYIQVGESVSEPLKYYQNNVIKTIELVNTMNLNNVKSIVFSSSAAVYGEPKKVPILEDDPKNPTNPYGESKLIIEKFLSSCDIAYGVKSVSLRYFNACGADPSGDIGEAHNPETHIIPLLLNCAISGKPFTVFGDDYATKDGTCIRDYIHVNDLATAHVLALERLINGGNTVAYNLGVGNGFSVKQIIDAANNVTGCKIKIKLGKRRAGDPAKLVASSKKAQKELKWKPRYTSVQDIISTAWNWHKKHPKGYS